MFLELSCDGRRLRVDLEVRELRQHIEWLDLLRQSLCNEIDPSRSIAEEARSTIKMPNKAWVEAHQSRTHEVRCDWIIGENDFAEVPMSSVYGSIALHGNYAIRNHELDRHRCADVENAAMNSLPMENILRPAILVPRHDSEHVLHAERNSSPMMGLDLRHRYNKIRIQNGPGKPQVFHTRIRGAR